MCLLLLVSSVCVVLKFSVLVIFVGSVLLCVMNLMVLLDWFIVVWIVLFVFVSCVCVLILLVKLLLLFVSVVILLLCRVRLMVMIGIFWLLC